MSTFAQIKASVSRKLLDPNTTAISGANVGDAVNEALDYWKKSQFWFNEGSSIATMVAGQSDFTALLPSDFQYEDQQNGFVILDGQIFYTLEKKSCLLYTSDAADDM
jgi:regulation of enolase protein 1 (concanavalin A-like superfamily)